MERRPPSAAEAAANTSQIAAPLARHTAAEAAAAPVRTNTRALRAYEKAGFAREGRALDTDVKNGRRVDSWVLVRRPPWGRRESGHPGRL